MCHPQKIFALVLCLFLLLDFQVNAAENNTDNPQSTGNEILTRLPNGLLVYIIRDQRFPLVCSRLYARTGSANENPELAGISHVLEHMVFKGTSHRPKGEVARDVEALGGYLNAATSFDKTWYLTDMPAAHWKIGMDVLKDMAFQATLDPAELEAEKNVVISELQRGEDSPMRKLFEMMQTASLKNTPYGRPIIGFENSIRAITVDDLKAYVKKYYQPQNMMLLVAGDIDPAQVLQHAEQLFGSLENSSDLPLPLPLDLFTAAQGSPLIEVSRGPWSKVYMGIALPAPGLRDLRSVELDVLAYLLGGDATSQFYEKFKYNQQLVDSIDVSNMSLDRAGMLSIVAQLDAGKVEQFWQQLTQDLGKLNANSFDDEAISRAKFNLEDSMDRASETLNGLTAWKGSIQFDLGGEQQEKNLRFTQRNVDKSQLQTAIATWLNPREARVRVLAPENAELPDLEGILIKNWIPLQGELKSEKGNASKTGETIDLGNGCKVILIPDTNTPYVYYDLLFPGGNALLKPEQQGLANLTANLLTAGSVSMTRPALERWLSQRAASLSARAGVQTFGISLSGPARFNQDYFGLLRDVTRKPRLDPGEFKREVDDMKSAILQRNDHPLSYMFAKLNPFIFPDNQPYGYDRLGSDETLATFNVTNTKDFWSKQSAQPWTLAVSGTFDRDEILEFVKSLPIPRVEKFELGNPHWGTQKNLELKLPGRNQAHLMQIFETVPPNHPDAPALMLLQSLLSGQSGLLFRQLRDEQGLGYTVTAFNHTLPKAGYMAFYIGTTEDKLAQAREGFAGIIEKIKKTPFSEQDLKAGANRLLGEYLRDRQSLGSRAGDAATNSVLGNPPDFQKLLIDKAATLQPKDLQEVARKYLHDPYDVTLLP